MIKSKVAFLENWLFSSQSGLFENFSDCSDRLDKSRPLKKPLYMIKTKVAFLEGRLLFNQSEQFKSN